jgi:hypothetical protein
MTTQTFQGISKMKRMICALACAMAANAFAWGSDGHSIIGEIAQRRLTDEARLEAERLLGFGVSLASVSNWADDYRTPHPETYRWHFINFPVMEDKYDPAVACAPTPTGDCIVAALQRNRATLMCPSGDAARRDALKFAAHFIGDVHQPFHTITEDQGGNLVKVEVDIREGRCPKCPPRRTQDNLHAVWDSGLITNTVWNWGAYVTRLEEGWLAGPEARGADGGTVDEWMMASHRLAAQVWPWLPPDRLIGDDYYRKALPIVDRQLSLAGLRLARFLNETLPARNRRERCG